MGTNSGAPWRTFARLLATVFVPGDVISLKAGDTFTETFTPTGSGVFDSATYGSTYSSAYSTAYAGYQAGATFSDLHSQLLANGVTEPTATNRANDLCGALARRDATRSAWSAAQGSSTWITLTSYGAGARPIITPGASVDAAIKFPHDFTGGWHINGVDIGATKVVGIDAEVSTGVAARGLWIENSNISTVTGGVVATADNPGYVNAGYNAFAPTGILTWWVDYVHLSHVSIDHCDVPMHLIGWRTGCYLDNVICDHSHVNGAWFSSAGGGSQVGPLNTVEQSNNLVVENSRFSYAGYDVGWYGGTAGVQINQIINLVFDTVEIDHTSNASFPVTDGIAFDWEYPSSGTLIWNCNIHDNSNAAFLTARQGAGQIGTLIFNTIFNNNGTQSPFAFPALDRSVPATDNKIYIGCTITRAGTPGVQKLFGDLHGGLTDTPQAAWVFPLTGPGANTVI